MLRKKKATKKKKTNKKKKDPIKQHKIYVHDHTDFTILEGKRRKESRRISVTSLWPLAMSLCH